MRAPVLHSKLAKYLFGIALALALALSRAGAAEFPPGTRQWLSEMNAWAANRAQPRQFSASQMNADFNTAHWQDWAARMTDARQIEAMQHSLNPPQIMEALQTMYGQLATLPLRFGAP